MWRDQAINSMQNITGVGEVEIDVARFPVDRYSPRRILGRGAAGTVYMCSDNLLGKDVAIKILHDLTPEQLISFQEEARATCKLSHPNVVNVLDFGATESGTPYMVMNHVDGISLEQLIKQNGAIDVQTASKIVESLCEALQYAHEQSIYHRDLKPSNVLISERDDGTIYVTLIDFGVAKVKEATGSTIEFQGRTIAGTPSYMSPDTILGYDYTVRSEIYSLGCIYFELLTGRPPFIAETALETIGLHAWEPVPRLKDVTGKAFPAQVENVIEKCLDKKPERRFRSMAELRQASASASYDALVNSSDGSVVHADKKQTGSFLIPGLVVFVSLMGLAAYLFCYVSRPFEAKRTKVHKDSYMIGLVPMDGGTISVSQPFVDRHSKKITERLGGPSTIIEGDLQVTSMRGAYTQMQGHRFLTDEGLQPAGRYEAPYCNFARSSICGPGLSNLRKDSVKDLILSRSFVDDSAFDALSGLTSIERLCLDDCDHISGRQVYKLARLPSLTKLSIGGAGLTGAVCSQLSTISSLKCLYLGPVALTQADLARLAKLPYLESLFLVRCKLVGDDVLSGLKNAKVKRLSFCRTSVNLSMLSSLRQNRSINYLYLLGHNRPAKKELKKMFPKCEIVLK
ncbi:MAG: serine/threonine protein kinase [Cyanobacteria bacterium]|nr:serine/threonine protein kinase [Cyanobacteriota bacterium]